MMTQTLHQKLVIQNNEVPVCFSKKTEFTSIESLLLKISELWPEKSFTLPLEFPIDNAKRILGFKPATSLEKEMNKIKNWLFTYNVKPELGSCEVLFIPKNPISVSLTHNHNG